MELSKNIVTKYNRLYREVVKYYNLEHKIVINSQLPLNYIMIADYGWGEFTGHNKKSYANNIHSHMEINFTYLLPFYKLLHQEDSYADISVEKLLVEINEVMKKMRSKI